MTLTLGHSIPWAGHLGKHKTTARIQRYFYWPGMQKDVAQFCRKCPESQHTSAKFPGKAPLQPLPKIVIPFECLGKDIVGQVEKSIVPAAVFFKGWFSPGDTDRPGL